MAVENVQIGCDGASGTAGAFIVRVEANGQSIHQTAVTGQSVPERGGEVWPWSLSWHIEGEADVVLTDWTHIDWATNEGTVQNVHATYHLSCPVATTTTVAETTTTAAPTTVAETPTTVAPTTVVLKPSSSEPVVTIGLEPSTSVNRVSTVDTSVDTSVVLNTAPMPSTTLTYSGQDFYVAPTTVWGPCFDDGSCLPGYELTTTTLGEPVGCCSEYVGDVTVTTVAVPHELAATGGEAAPMVAAGVVFVALGVVALLVRRPWRA